MTLVLFASLLILCIVTRVSILYAMAAGYILFALHSLKSGFSLSETLKMSLEGIRTVSGILVTFVMIGMLTGLWRSCGTIASIVSYAAGMVSAPVFILLSFLLNCLVSFLTGTAFGTAATMGTVCMTIGHALSLNPAAMGGAILAGAYFGDRCSPVSTSALLVSELTKTDIYGNIRKMAEEAAVPFLISCLIYLVLGRLLPYGHAQIPDVRGMFSGEFRLGAVPVIPAAVILIFALCRINVRKSMLASILAAIAVCLFFQHREPGEILRTMIFGYRAEDHTLRVMIDGGGLVSMLKVTAIVCLSSSYSGIFQKTGLLDGLKEKTGALNKKMSTYGVYLLTAFAAGAVACNQTLTIMLTDQLCRDLLPEAELGEKTEKTDARRTPEIRRQKAMNLEDTAVIISPLIPWSIASGVTLSTVGAPLISIAAACFLYILPLWRLVYGRLTAKRVKR